MLLHINLYHKMIDVYEDDLVIFFQKFHPNPNTKCYLMIFLMKLKSETQTAT